MMKAHVMMIAAAVVLSGHASAQEQTRAPERNESGQMGYVLGPGDQVSLLVVDAEEISQKPFRIDGAGYINLPLAGPVKAGGLSVAQLHGRLITALLPYIREPEVAVTVSEFRSQPVSIIGAVNAPGVHYLQGNKTLIEALSLAGGLRSDAGHTVKITRRLEAGSIPLPTAVDDVRKGFSIAEVDVTSVLEAKYPEQNILIKANDVVSVPRAGVVYVVGEVSRSGGFTLGEHESISVLQALALAGGLSRAAGSKNAKLLRFSPGAAKRTEVAVNLNKIISGKVADVQLRPDDILFVPNSRMKAVTARAAEVAVNAGSGILIWRTAY